MVQELVLTEIVCTTLLWLGLKYFNPDNRWMWWFALPVGVYAGWGVWMWGQNSNPILMVFKALFEHERYMLLIQILGAFIAFLFTTVISLLAVAMFVRRLFR